MSVNLDRFSVADAVELGARLRTAAEDATSMEEVANAIVRLICEGTTAGDDGQSCVLVRCFVTDARSRLPRRLAEMVPLTDDDDPDGQSLVLLATEGMEAEWCDRRRSAHHQVIPLVGSAMPETFPMITRMFRQFGIPISALVGRSVDSFVDPSERAFGVFHVEHAAGSSDVPDQDFIAKYGVSSVVGIGGPLPTGDVFAVLIFSQAPIDRQVAELLQPWALSIKLALLPVLDRVFSDELAVERPQTNEAGRHRVEAAALRTLLALQEGLIADQYRRLAVETLPDNALTPREQEIIELVATGATNKQIAANLDLSAGTVKWHLYNLFQKLAVETRTEAVLAAQDRGLLR
jgi:DNA-binding CsgD family transcriptional regulator